MFDSHSDVTSDSMCYWLFRVFMFKSLIRASGHLSKENRQLPRNNVVWWSNQQENFPAALQKKVKPHEILFINLPSHLNIFVLKIAVFNSYLCVSFAVKNLILTFPLERIVQKCQKLPSISFRWFYKKLEQKNFIRFTGIGNDGPLHLFKETALMRSKVGLSFLFLRQQDGWYREWKHSFRNSAASCVSFLLISFNASSAGIPCHWFGWDHVSVQKKIIWESQCQRRTSFLQPVLDT